MARNFDVKLWDLSEMFHVLKHEIEARERTMSVGVSSFERRHERKANKECYLRCALNSSLQRDDESIKACVFCNWSNTLYGHVLNIQIQVTKREILKRNGLCFICFEKGNIFDNCTMNYSCNKCRGCEEHRINLCLQKSENSETKADENNDKKNDVNVNSLPTENYSNTIIPTTPALKVAMFYYKQQVQKLLTKESGFLRKLEFHFIQVVREVI